MIPALDWEAVGDHGLQRAAVPNGWLVRQLRYDGTLESGARKYSPGDPAFVPDPEHAWGTKPKTVSRKLEPGAAPAVPIEALRETWGEITDDPGVGGLKLYSGGLDPASITGEHLPGCDLEGEHPAPKFCATVVGGPVVDHVSLNSDVGQHAPGCNLRDPHITPGACATVSKGERLRLNSDAVGAASEDAVGPRACVDCGTEIIVFTDRDEPPRCMNCVVGPAAAEFLTETVRCASEHCTQWVTVASGFTGTPRCADCDIPF